jgi:ubiquinone/menaquinone biosynthesis C-methylase UbiE
MIIQPGPGPPGGQTHQEAAVRFYSEVVFPRLCDLLLGRPWVARHRRELLAHASGDVLEIGFGTGLNLPHYPAQVRQITTVDPNAGMHRLAQRRVRRSAIPVDQRVLSGDRLPFPDNAFDCAVSTFTLCSIDQVSQALAEVYRVLKPVGRFLFLEHGLSPEPGVQKWQRRLNWLEMRLAGGCRLDRNIKALVAAPPFSSVEVEEFYLENTPKTHGSMYRGIARK